MSETPIVCEHGQLERVCEVCELVRCLAGANALIAILRRERDVARAEIEALRKDARRYRWLRLAISGGQESVYVVQRNSENVVDGADLDAAVDAALAREEP